MNEEVYTEKLFNAVNIITEAEQEYAEANAEEFDREQAEKKKWPTDYDELDDHESVKNGGDWPTDYNETGDTDDNSGAYDSDYDNDSDDDNDDENDEGNEGVWPVSYSETEGN